MSASAQIPYRVLVTKVGLDGHDRGIKVLLKPHIWLIDEVPGQWRGTICLRQPGRAAANCRNCYPDWATSIMGLGEGGSARITGLVSRFL